MQANFIQIAEIGETQYPFYGVIQFKSGGDVHQGYHDVESYLHIKKGMVKMNDAPAG